MAILTGTAQSETLIGGVDADLISGRGGSDRLVGNAGADTISGGTGNDSVVGENAALPPLTPAAGTGNTIFGQSGNDLIFAGLGADAVFGGAGDDTLFGGIGSSFGTFIEGGAGANWTADRNDVLTGGRGNDVVDGAGGNDALEGSEGDDTLVGGPGADVLAGGPGADSFAFGRQLALFGGPDSGVGEGNRDVILDFRQGDDLIDLSRLDSVIGSPPGSGPGFLFLGEDEFVASDQIQLRSFRAAGNTIIQIAGPDSDGTPDAEILLVGRFRLTEDDFILG